jgi:hypothetical protein
MLYIKRPSSVSSREPCRLHLFELWAPDAVASLRKSEKKNYCKVSVHVRTTLCMTVRVRPLVPGGSPVQFPSCSSYTVDIGNKYHSATKATQCSSNQDASEVGDDLGRLPRACGIN